MVQGLCFGRLRCQCIKSSHVLGRQREVEDVDVLSDARRGLALEDDDIALLNVPPQTDLRGALAETRSDALDRIAREYGTTTLEWFVGLDNQALGLEVIHPLLPVQHGVVLEGVHLWLDGRGLHQVLEVGRRVIRDAQGLRQALPHECLESDVGLDMLAGPGPMNHHAIHGPQPQLVDGDLRTAQCRRGIAEVCCPDLCGDEELRAVMAFAQPLPHGSTTLGLVAVEGGEIEVPDACIQGRSDGAIHLFPRDVVQPQSQLLHAPSSR
mmetsp:Transcript_29010/g.73613  ORF Transcript_29010/g.73613 Transcript_29010/m.73613 type:complete len:267 (+) Transcript_29010:125-925(+)